MEPRREQLVDPESAPDANPFQSMIVSYIRSPRGILRILQAVLSLVVFIMVMSSDMYSGAGWVSFVSINGLIQACIWGALRMFQVVAKIIANQFIEFIMFTFIGVFYLIAFIVAAVHGYVPIAAAQAAFCFVCTFIFGADVLLQFRGIHEAYAARAAQAQVQQVQNPGPFVEPASAKQYEPPPAYDQLNHYSSSVPPPPQAGASGYATSYSSQKNLMQY